jgi:hypothetical protein
MVGRMNTHNPGEEARQPQAEHHPETQPYYAEKEVSLRPMFRILWSYRKTIEIALGAIIAVLIIAVLGKYLSQSSERIGGLAFRLVFEGVDRGQYPNGTTFSTAEIISTPVLSEVYANNKLESYFPNFDEFKNSVFMMEANPDVQLLDYEYQTRLADTKLSPVDRVRIEAEYKKKRESLSAPIYSLNFRRQERAAAIPTSLLDKVMQDILATWARQADQRKGALKYNIPVYSRNILQKEFVQGEDYIVAVDILRAKVVRISTSIDQLSSLPGASVIRVGPERISLREVKVNLEDILRFKLQPLVGAIRASGISKDPKFLLPYLENQLFQIKLEREEELSKVKTLQDSLRAYMSERGMLPVQGTQAGGTGARASGTLETPALIPQFGESFLDRLVALSTQNTDIKYRQELTDKIITEGLPTATLDKEVMYYEDMIKSFRGLGGGASNDKSAAVQAVKERMDDAMAGVLKALDQINAIYQELSTQNLNPQTMLYRVTSPFTSRTLRSFSLRSAALYGALTMFLALILVPIGCLIHNYFRSEVKS